MQNEFYKQKEQRMMKKLCRNLAKAAAAGAGFYLWAQTPRREHPGLGRLRRYRYAHRGLHDLEKGIPENTLPAFAAAAAKGYGAELDVHMTLDRRLVVIHDSR
ncbi:MAG: glycerophosphodiester phosphodiesterase family protein, partial [Butyricicoccaceae bacterium]